MGMRKILPERSQSIIKSELLHIDSVSELIYRDFIAGFGMTSYPDFTERLRTNCKIVSGAST